MALIQNVFLVHFAAVEIGHLHIQLGLVVVQICGTRQIVFLLLCATWSNITSPGYKT